MFTDYFGTIREHCSDIMEVGSGVKNHRSDFPGKRFVTLDINPESGADIIGDAHAIPAEDASFDCVMAQDVLEHLHSPQVFIQEIKRVLRPQGYVLVTAPFLHPYHGGMNAGNYCPDYYRFSEDGLRFLFKDFDLEVTSDGGFFVAMGFFFPPFRRFFNFLDRFYPNGKSRRQYIVFGRKKSQ